MRDVTVDFGPAENSIPIWEDDDEPNSHRIKASALWILSLNFETLPSSVHELRRELTEAGYLLTPPAKGCACTVETGRWTNEDAVGTSAVFYLHQNRGLNMRKLATLRCIVLANGSIKAVHDGGDYQRLFSSSPSDEDIAATLRGFVRAVLPDFSSGL
ncbi:hypothetical protein [Sabulicella rubraurantiaca]|uniref:hypothetical protein n=1 Tax=Sabulicella rubraurantiaca TaxID=2811429 RepID=UPI001A96AD43|nr:hypothetical protein [Sabulicella rubraurantiaca]